jgi:anaerobic magnesium-protoporphyrin IX monomethyl ester cyclase
VTTAPEAAERPLTVVLVRPPAMLPVTARNAVREIPPIGLAYLAAALGRAGHRARIVDAFGEAPDRVVAHDDGYRTNGLTIPEIVARIPRDADLIGVTCMFSNGWLYCRRTIAAIAAAFPGVPIVVGGEHPTADHARLLRRTPEVLCCALGEGEETVVEIAARLAQGRPLDDVEGIALRDASGEPVRTPPRARIRDVDDVPWPDWSTVPLANYLDNDIGADAWVAPTMPILASRGCPYRCTFCSNPQMFGTTWIARDPAQVVAEMQHYHRTLGVRYFEFHDLTMIVRRDWILRFCALLADARLDVQWSMPSGTRSEALDAEALAAMHRSGCRSFSYAAESGSLPELRRIKKRVDPHRMLASMRTAVRLGLVAKCHLIFGLPDQTWRDVARSVAFATRMAVAGVHDLGCYAFSPYPGSELYGRLVAEGRIDPEADDYDHVLAQNLFTNYRLRRSWTPHIGARVLPWLCLGTMAWFYALQLVVRPRRLAATVAAVARRRPQTYLQRMLVTVLRRPGRHPAAPVAPPVTADGLA